MIGFFEKNKILFFLFLLFREPNISPICKIGRFKKAGVPRSTLWLYFSIKNYEKKAQGKKFTQGTPKDRIFCKK